MKTKPARPRKEQSKITVIPDALLSPCIAGNDSWRDQCSVRVISKLGHETTDQFGSRECVIVKKKVVVVPMTGAPVLGKNEVYSLGESEVSSCGKDLDFIVRSLLPYSLHSCA
jgi:hypothetical protein